MPEAKLDNVNVNVKKAGRVGRKRRTLGWILLTLGLLVATVWLVSGWCTVRYGTSRRFLQIGAGVFWKNTSPGDTTEPNGWWTRWHQPGDNWGWSWWHVWNTDNVPWEIYLGVYSRTIYPDGSGRIVYTSHHVWLWPYPLVLCGIGVPLVRSGVLARRRAVMHACAQCGYSLVGLAKDAPCPECGKGAKALT